MNLRLMLTRLKNRTADSSINLIPLRLILPRYYEPSGTDKVVNRTQSTVPSYIVSSHSQGQTIHHAIIDIATPPTGIKGFWPLTATILPVALSL